MNQHILRTGKLCLLLLLLSAPVFGQNNEYKGEFSGSVFTDYYWIAQNHNEAIEGDQGFWFRRVYLAFDKGINESFSTRLRLEMASNGRFPDASGKMNPVVKDAYLKWKNDRHQVLVGISPTPTWGLVEEVWGYRAVEKTPQDLYGMGGSRDFGISALGLLDAAGKLKYHLMVGNGEGNNGEEIDLGKKVMLSLIYQLTPELIMQVYGDVNKRDDVDLYSFNGLLGYQSDAFNAGVFYAAQQRNYELEGANNNEYASVISAFTNFDLTDNTTAMLRADYAFEGISGSENNTYLPIYSDSPSTFITGGIDFVLGNNVNLIPNIEAVIYGEDSLGNQPTSDIIPRLTLAFSF